MVLTGGDSGEIMSGGFNVESILLKRQLATTDENVYKSLRNTVIPFGLLHENIINEEKDKSLSNFLTDGLESQIIDDELYSKLLRDYSASDEILSKKKKNNKSNKKNDIKKTKHKKTHKMK